MIGVIASLTSEIGDRFMHSSGCSCGAPVTGASRGPDGHGSRSTGHI
jgi:hypothetical protein